MGNSISLNVLADDAHLTVNSQRLYPRQLGSPLSPRSDASSEVSAALSSTSSADSLESLDERITVPKSPHHAKLRQCWICYGEEEISENPAFLASWVAPCNCKGTTKWVHQACLLDWIDSQVINNATLVTNRTSPLVNTLTPNNSSLNQNSSNLSTPMLSVNGQNGTAANPEPRFQGGDGPLVLESFKLTCPQCHAPYKISEAYALPRRVLLLIDYLAKCKERALMYSTLGLVSTSIYTVAFSYGLISGWMVGGSEFLQFVRDSFDPVQGSLLNRFQISAGIPLTPLLALSSAFSTFSWTYPLIPLFLFDGRHRISISQPRGILLILPLIWTGHKIVTESLIPAVFRKFSRNNDEIIESPSPSPAESTISLTIGEDSNSFGSNEDSAITAPSNSTVKISILSTTAALLFPSAAALTGWAVAALLPKVFSSVSPFYRSLIGASVLVTFKDLSKILYWYQNVRLRKFRRVLDRSE